MSTGNAFSHFLEQAFANAVLRGGNYTGPANVYLGLFTADPGEGNTGTEVSGGSYVRQVITFTPPATQTSGTLLTLAADVTFPQATAGWGMITNYGLYDAPAAGNELFHGALAAAVTITIGDTFTLSAATSDLSILLD